MANKETPQQKAARIRREKELARKKAELEQKRKKIQEENERKRKEEERKRQLIAMQEAEEEEEEEQEDNDDYDDDDDYDESDDDRRKKKDDDKEKDKENDKENDKDKEHEQDKDKDKSEDSEKNKQKDDGKDNKDNADNKQKEPNEKSGNEKVDDGTKGGQTDGRPDVKQNTAEPKTSQPGGGPTQPTDPAMKSGNTGGTNVAGNGAQSGSNIAGEAGKEAVKQGGEEVAKETGKAVGQETVKQGGKTVVSNAGGAAAEGGTGGALATVLAVIAIILIVLVLLTLIAVLLGNIDVFSNNREDGEYITQLRFEDVTVNQVIEARQKEWGKDLLRFNIKNENIFWFFSIADSEMSRLLYKNLTNAQSPNSSPYDQVIDELKKVKEEATSNAIKYESLGSVLEVKGTEENITMIDKYGLAGLSISNYLLYAENDEFTNMFLSDTLSSRTITEVYDAIIKEEKARGDVSLRSITENFRYIIARRYGEEMAKEFFTSGDDVMTIDEVKQKKDAYVQLYQNYLKTDLAFSLIYKYMFSGIDHFNTITWNCFVGNHDTRTSEKLDYSLKTYKGSIKSIIDSETNQEIQQGSGTYTEEALLIPSVYVEDPDINKEGKSYEEMYEQNITQIINTVYPYLMHWVVPYSLNVATGDYTFALDAMYNMKGPIKLDVYKMENKHVEKHAYVEENIKYTSDCEFIYECNICKEKGNYAYHKYSEIAGVNGYAPHRESHSEDDLKTYGLSYATIYDIDTYKRYYYNYSWYANSLHTNSKEYPPANDRKVIVDGVVPYYRFYKLDDSNPFPKDEKDNYKIAKNDDGSEMLVDDPVETIDNYLVTKLRYAEGMYDIFAADYIFTPYDNKNPNYTYDNLNGYTGILTREDVFNDEISIVPGSMERTTYKITSLGKEDYDTDGTRKNTGEKINRIEWFLDYGEKADEDHVMVPDKNDSSWYLKYYNPQSGLDDPTGQRDFRSFYHISLKEAMKPLEDGSESKSILSKNLYDGAFCEYIKVKYKDNIDNLRQLVRKVNAELAEKASANNTSDSDKINTDYTALRFIAENCDVGEKYGYKFEIDSQVDQNLSVWGNFKETITGIFSSWIGTYTTLWNWMTGDNFDVNSIFGKSAIDFVDGNVKQSVVYEKAGVTDPIGVDSVVYSPQPLVDACFKLNTVQGYSYKNLEFSLEEIQAFYDENNKYASGILVGNTQPAYITSLPQGGLAWPSEDSNEIDEESSSKHNGVDILNTKRAKAALSGTIHVVSMPTADSSGAVSIISDDGGYYVASYFGLSSLDYKEGEHVDKGATLGLVSKPRDEDIRTKGCTKKHDNFLHYEVSYNPDGFKIDNGVININKRDNIDPKAFYYKKDDGTYGSVDAGIGLYNSYKGHRLYTQAIEEYEQYDYSYLGYGTLRSNGCPFTAAANCLSVMGYNVTPLQMYLQRGTSTVNSLGANPSNATSAAKAIDSRIGTMTNLITVTSSHDAANDIRSNLQSGYPVAVRDSGDRHFMAILDIDDSGTMVYLATGFERGFNFGITNSDGAVTDGWYNINDVASHLKGYYKYSE